MLKITRKRAVLNLAVLAVIFLLVPSLALATGGSVSATTGSDTTLPWESGLQTLTNSITGPVAGFIAVLGICVCGGMLAFGGELNEIVKRSMQVILAICICVGAAAIVTKFTGSATTVSGATIGHVTTADLAR